MGKYRLTLLFVVTAIVVMVTATVTVNLVIGNLAEDNLIRIAEENTTREALHIEAMIRGPQSTTVIQPPQSDATAGTIPATPPTGPLSLDSAPFYEGLLRTIPTLAQGLNIPKLSIFDLKGKSVWSTDLGTVGALTVEPHLFDEAINGSVTSHFMRDLQLVDLAGEEQTLDVVLTYLPLRDTPSGNVIGIAEIFRDVTTDVAIQVDDAKSVVLWTTIGTMGGLFLLLVGFVVLADVRISRSRLTLEDRVRQRTQELENANEQLLQAQDQLVRTEKLAVIGQLAGSVAHDLRNPLGAINNAVYYLKRQFAASELVKSNPRIGQFLDIAEEEVEQSNRIISDLMAFARVNPPSLAPINLQTVIESALSSMQNVETIQVVKRFEPELPNVLADDAQLRRVFDNLMKNSQEAMPEGGDLTIEARKVNQYVEVAFSDTGIGISEENLKRVFDPLFTTKSQGTGLGLSASQQIVSNHGGTLDVVSMPGAGTTFTVRLPADAAGSSGGR